VAQNRRGRNSDRAPVSGGKRCRGSGKGSRRAPLSIEDVSGRENRSPSRWVAEEAILAESDPTELTARGKRRGDGDISGPGSVACLSGKKTPARAAESWPKRAVAACKHRPPVRSRAPSITNPEATRFFGCSSLTCGLQTSARRISGSLVARHRKIRVDGGSSSSGAEAALTSCRGITTSERVRGALLSRVDNRDRGLRSTGHAPVGFLVRQKAFRIVSSSVS